MSRSDYGISRVNSYLNPQLNGNSNSFSSVGNVSARVISIVLDSSHPRFDDLGGWTALGAIEYDLVSNPKKLTPQAYPVAYPLDSNIKRYPLINEIVLINGAFNTAIDKFLNGENITGNEGRVYYSFTVNAWNHPHHNGYSFLINDSPSTQNKSYSQTQAGSINVVSNTPVSLDLGKTFIERSNIHPLRPFEGDIILEGRWGNSIRFGSTVMSYASSNENDWSAPNVGKNGDPIIIISNGQGNQNSNGTEPIVENVNNNESSIYLTSTQKIPLKAKSTDYTSYNKEATPISPEEYYGPQIILNSGRLVFNSYIDHILLSSAKSINLNSQESVNIDTKKFITQADKIFLGKEDLATEPLLLGDTTAQLLRDLTSSVKELTNTLQTLTSAPVAPFTPATFPTLLVPTTKVLTILNSLEKQLGTSKENCTITSKRNFTL